MEGAEATAEVDYCFVMTLLSISMFRSSGSSALNRGVIVIFSHCPMRRSLWRLTRRIKSLLVIIIIIQKASARRSGLHVLLQEIRAMMAQGWVAAKESHYMSVMVPCWVVG